MSSSYINQIDAALAAVQPIAGQNLTITPSSSGGLIYALANSIAVSGTVSAQAGVILFNPGIATSPSNQFNAPSLSFQGSFWNGTLSHAQPDIWSFDSTSIGNAMPNQASTILTLNHNAGANAYFTLGPGIFRFMSTGENVLGTVGVQDLFVQTEQTNGTVFPLSAAANAVGSTTTYTGTISVTIPQAGSYITIAGFTNLSNNGRFIVQSGAINTVTVYNAAGIAETHPATLTIDNQIWSNGTITSQGYGAVTGFHLFGTPYQVTMGSQAEPLAVPFVVTMAGNATDGGFLRIINDGATGNHGLEVGAVIDGTGVAPILLHVGHFSGQSGVHIPTNLIVTGTTTFTTANPTFFSSTGTGAVVLATSPTISGATLSGTITTSGTETYTAANPTFFSAQGNGSLVQLSTGGFTSGDVVTQDANGNTVDSGTTLASLTAKANLYDATGIAPLATDNHTACGTSVFPTGSPNFVTINLTGAAQFSSGGTYVVQITLTQDPTAFLPFSIWVDTQTATSFNVNNTKNTDNSTFAWTATGY